MTLGDARRGLTAISSRLAERADGLASLTGPADDHPVPSLRLLGAFDPLLLGWASREMFLAPGGPVISVNGLFRPFMLVQGKGTTVWRITRGKVVPGETGPLDTAQRSALTAEIADIERFLKQPASRPPGS